MPLFTYTFIGLLTLAGGRDAIPGNERPGESHSAFAASSGVQRADGSMGGRLAQFIPLRPMTGDVEILHGDPEKAGEPFVMRIRELPGTRIPLHTHPVDEHITVLQGTLYFAVGERWEEAALKELKTGSYAFAPKGSTMYGYSPDGAVVQVHGIGPFEIHWHGGLRTLDYPDAQQVFKYRKGDAVRASRGVGTIRQGYASGAVIQYEIEQADGKLLMADETEIRPK